MEMNVRTKIDINVVCSCGNPLTIIYHKKWYGQYAIAVEPCEECMEEYLKAFLKGDNKEETRLTSGDICDTIPNK